MSVSQAKLLKEKTKLLRWIRMFIGQYFDRAGHSEMLAMLTVAWKVEERALGLGKSSGHAWPMFTDSGLIPDKPFQNRLFMWDLGSLEHWNNNGVVWVKRLKTMAKAAASSAPAELFAVAASAAAPAKHLHVMVTQPEWQVRHCLSAAFSAAFP